MDLHTFEYRDPAALINEVAERVPLSEDAVYVVLVARPDTAQDIVSVRRLGTPALIDDYIEACRELHDVMQTLPIPDRPHPLDHSVMTLVVRPGPCVFGPNESRWMNAWRYSNHFANAFSGGVILVTEHGWCDFMTNEAGHSPTMATSHHGHDVHPRVVPLEAARVPVQQRQPGLGTYLGD